MRWPGVPFSSGLVLADIKSADTQFSQQRGKPRWHKMSSTNGHASVSKAHAMSIFRSRLDLFLSCNSLADACTILKVSCMALPVMKVLCEGCTISPIQEGSRLARTLAISFSKELIRPFLVGVLSHSFQLCHIIKCRDEIMNETTFFSGQFHITVF
jgi:hypothetical protein